MSFVRQILRSILPPEESAKIRKSLIEKTIKINFNISKIISNIATSTKVNGALF